MSSHGDYLQFEGGVAGRLRRFGWDGPWPPPERLGAAVGPVTGKASVFDPALIDRWLLADLERYCDVGMFDRVSFSQLPEQGDGSFVVRGALYRPVAG